MHCPRILLADDHRLFAEGLKSLLGDEYDIVGIAEDGAALLEAVAKYAPDLVVMDVSMPKLNGIECVRRLRESHPNLKVILLTMHEDISLATAAIRAGASGYILKHCGTQDVLRAVNQALQNGVHISPRIAKDVMSALASGKESKPEITQRQMEILRMLVKGLSAKEIAAQLHLSPRTVEFHKYNAMERVGVTTSAELIAYAIKQGIGPV